MKKIISAALALGVALTLTGTAFARAADDADDLDLPEAAGATEISYDLDGENTYTITIPATLTISGADQEDALEISATDVKILAGHVLNISVNSAHQYNVVREEEHLEGYNDILTDDGMETVPVYSTTRSMIPYDLTLGLASEMEEDEALQYISRHADMMDWAVDNSNEEGDDNRPISSKMRQNLRTMNKYFDVLHVEGEGWLTEGVEGSVTLGVYTSTEYINNATLGGEHTDTLTFRVAVEESPRDTDMAAEMVNYSHNNILS